MIEVELPDGRILEIEAGDDRAAARAAKAFLDKERGVTAPRGGAASIGFTPSSFMSLPEAEPPPQRPAPDLPLPPQPDPVARQIEEYQGPQVEQTPLSLRGTRIDEGIARLGFVPDRGHELLAETARPLQMDSPESFGGQRITYDEATGLERAGDQLRSGWETFKQGLAATRAKSMMEALALADKADGGATPVEAPLWAELSPEQRQGLRDRTERALGSAIQSFITSRADQQEFLRNPNVQALAEAVDSGRYRDAWRILSSDFGGIVQQAAVESLPNQILPMAGALVGGLGAGALGVRLGAFGGGYAADVGPRFVEALSKRMAAEGVNGEDGAAVAAWLRGNLGAMREEFQAAQRGAFGPAIADAASFALARGLRPGAGALRNTMTGLRNMGIEIGTEGAGEAAAGIFAEGKVTPSEVLMEMLGAGPQAVGTTAIATLQEARDMRRSGAQAIEPVPNMTTAGAPARLPPGLEVPPSPQRGIDRFLGEADFTGLAQPVPGSAGGTGAAAVLPAAPPSGEPSPPPGAASPLGTPPGGAAVPTVTPDNTRPSLEQALNTPTPTPDQQAEQAAQEKAQSEADRTAGVQRIAGSLPPGWTVDDEDQIIQVYDPNGMPVMTLVRPPATEQDFAALMTGIAAQNQEGVADGSYPQPNDVPPAPEAPVAPEQVSDTPRGVKNAEELASALGSGFTAVTPGNTLYELQSQPPFNGIPEVWYVNYSGPGGTQVLSSGDDLKPWTKQQAIDAAVRNSMGEQSQATNNAPSAPSSDLAVAAQTRWNRAVGNAQRFLAGMGYDGDITRFPPAAAVEEFESITSRIRAPGGELGAATVRKLQEDLNRSLSNLKRHTDTNLTGIEPSETPQAPAPQPKPEAPTPAPAPTGGPAILNAKDRGDFERKLAERGSARVGDVTYGVRQNKNMTGWIWSSRRDNEPVTWDKGPAGASDPWSKEEAIRKAAEWAYPTPIPTSQPPAPNVTTPAPTPGNPTDSGAGNVTTPAPDVTDEDGPRPLDIPNYGDFGTPEAPNMVPLALAYRDAFLDGRRFATIVQARRFAANLLGGIIDPKSVAAKTLDEAIEGGVVLAARSIIEGLSGLRANNLARYDALVDLYERQPLLNVRTGSSRERQAYSTPAPLAFLVASIARVMRKAGDMRWLEPTAGTGQLLILADPDKVDVGEIDDQRANFLREAVGIPGTAVQVGDATNMVWTRLDADAVVGNPPFGLVRADGTGPAKRYRGPNGFQTTHIDHAIMMRALDGMADDGMAVFIVGAATNDDAPEGKRKDAYNADSWRSLFRQLFNGFNVVDHFTVAGSLYERQGAAWPVDVIVIAGRGKTEGRLYPTGNLPRIYRSWKEIRDDFTSITRTAAEARKRLADDSVGAGGQPPADGNPSADGNAGQGDGPGGVSAPPSVPGSSNDGPSGTGGNANGAGSPGAGSVANGGGGRPRPGGGGTVRDDGQPNGGNAGGTTGPSEVAGTSQGSNAGSGGSNSGDGPAGVAAPSGASGDVSSAFDQALDDLFGPEPTAPPSAPSSANNVTDAFDQALDDVFGKEPTAPADNVELKAPETIEEARRFIRLAASAGDKPALQSLVEDLQWATDPQAIGVRSLARAALEMLQGRERGPRPIPGEPPPRPPRLSPPPSNRPPKDRAPPKDKAPPRTPKDKAKDLVSNTVSGSDKALAGLAALFGGNSRLNMGLGFDEETWAKAKPLFIQAAQKFRAAASNINELMRAMVQELRDAFGMARDALMAMRVYVERFVSDVVAGKISLDPEKKDPPRDKNENNEQETDLQVSYTPQSRAEAVGTLAPVNMRDSMQAALERLAERVGDIDEFVAERLGYTLNEVVGTDGKPGYFSAEQVDALALAFDAIDNGAGFVIGDQTGVGKGRFVAAMLRYAKRQGLTPIFVTKDPGLYGDMYRDTNAIGMLDFKAAITNNDLRGEKAIPLPGRRGTNEKDGDRVLATAPDAQHRQMIADMTRTGSLPNDADALFTTYSQLQRIGGRETRRHDLLRALAPNAMFVLDESHEAGGTENVKIDPETGEPIPTRADFVRELILLSRGTVYSSATWAKNPYVMSLYSKTDLSLIGQNPDDLQNMLAAGGVPLQQTISNMLTEAGQYVRRERSFAGVEVSPTIVNADLVTAERFADALRRLFVVDQVMAEIREEFADDVAEGTGNAGAANPSLGNAGLSMSPSGFASVMHNLIAQGLLAIKVPAAVDAIIESMKAGRKPVIALSSTMESALRDFAEDAAQRTEGKMGFPTFNYLLERYVQRMRRVTFKDPERDEPIYVIMTDDQIRAYGGPSALTEYKAAEKLAQTVKLDGMPISPIDYIARRLTEAGFKVGEITGRGITLDYSLEGDEAVFTPREASSAAKKRTMNAFNEGNLDAVILNRSGSTGFSLHASRDFSDQRQREMFLLQAEADINIMMQVFGRIHRTGQVVLPIYTIVLADLPSEKRPAARLMKNLAGLNANTSSSKKNAFSFDAPEIFNEYGDQAVLQVMQDEAEIARLLDVQTVMQGATVQPGYAGKVTGRLAILPPDLQAEMWSRIEAAYNAIIEVMDSTGQNTLEAKTLDLDARTDSSIVLVPETNSATPFGREARLERINIKSQGRPFSDAEINERLEKNEGQNNKVAGWLETATEFHAAQDAAATNAAASAQEDLAAAADIEDEKDRVRATERANAKLTGFDTKRRKMRENLDTLKSYLTQYGVGDYVRLSVGNETLIGRIVNMTWKPGKNPLALGALSWTVAVADPVRQIDVTGASLSAGRATLQSAGRNAFEAAMQGLGGSDRRETRYMVTGNLAGGFAAIQGLRVAKQFTMFSMADGTMRAGVLLSRAFRPDRQLADLPVRFATPEQVVEFLRSLPGQAIVDTDNKVMTIQAITPTSFLFRVRTQGGKPFTLNRAARALLRGGDFVQRRGTRFAEGTAETIDAATRILTIYKDSLGTEYQTDTQKAAARRITGDTDLAAGFDQPPGATDEGEGSLYANPFDPALFMRLFGRPAARAVRAAAAGMRERNIAAVKANWANTRLPPGVVVDEGWSWRDLLPLWSMLQRPSRMFRKWPALAALVDQGIAAERRMNNWQTRMNGRLDVILRTLEKQKGDRAKVAAALFDADANEVDIARKDVADKHFAAHDLSPAEATAARELNALVRMNARLVDNHRRAMMPKVRKRKAEIWNSMTAIMDRAAVKSPEYQKMYARRARLNAKIRNNVGDLAAHAAEIESINTQLRMMRAADPKLQERMAELQTEYDALEARLANTSVQRRVGYFPHKFFGSWRMFKIEGVDDETGEQIRTEITSDQGFYDTEEQAVEAARAYLKDNPGAQLRIERKVSLLPSGAGGAVLSDAGYSRLRRGLEEQTGIEGQELSDMLSGVARRRSRRRVFAPGMFRTGAEGFSEDIQRVLRTHISQSVRYVEMDKLKFAYVATTERLGLSPSRAQAIKMEGKAELLRALESWWTDVNGNKQQSEEVVDGLLHKLGLPGSTMAAFAGGAAVMGAASNPILATAFGGYLGFRMYNAMRKGGDFPTRTLMGDLTSDMAHLKLGMLVNIASSAVNLSQTLINTYPVLGEKWTAIGIKRALPAMLSQARNRDKPGMMSADAILLRRADVMTDISIQADAAPLLAEDAGLVKGIKRVSMAPFMAAEHFNRAVAFMGALARAEAKGLSPAAAFQEAQEVLKQTQFHQGIADRPELLRTTVLKLPTQFKNFMIQQIGFAFDLWSDKRQNPGAVARFLLGLFLAAGTIGILPLALADWWLDWLFGVSPIRWMKDRAIRAGIMGEWAGTTADVLMRGLPTLLQMDLSGRVGMGQGFIPNSPADLMQGPFIGTAVRLRELASNNRQEIVDYLAALSPAANPLRMLEAGANGATIESADFWSGKNFFDGKSLVRNPQMRGMPEFNMTNRELITQGLGFRNLRQSLVADAREIDRANRKEGRKDANAYLQEMVQAERNGRPERIPEIRQEAAQNGVRIPPQRIRDALRDARRDRPERDLRNAPRDMRPEMRERLRGIDGRELGPALAR